MADKLKEKIRKIKNGRESRKPLYERKGFMAAAAAVFLIFAAFVSGRRSKADKF